MSGDVIAMLIGVTASLFLAWRSLQSHRVPFERKALMAVAWVVIIAVLTFAISRFGT